MRINLKRFGRWSLLAVINELGHSQEPLPTDNGLDGPWWYVRPPTIKVGRV